MQITLTRQDGSPAELILRKLSFNLIDMVYMTPVEAADTVAHLFIKPERRTADEVKQLFDSLDEESKFEVYSQGWQLNEENFNRYDELRKKHSARSGRMSQEQMMQKLLDNPEKLAALTTQIMSQQSTPPEASSEATTTIEPSSSGTVSA